MSATGTIIGVIVLVVALIVGPFATLRAISYYRDQRKPPPAAPTRDDEDDPDRPSGFW
ncbi:hypothetical protein [Solimonas flava]|uniref:hypothetical protein n=1 Tax=Solimonas flava TaxID=415849 RepID=UPI0003FC528F|nr:hypothetical protein [Solimonas flava]